MSETTCHMSISLDGFVAGPDQSLEHPLGRRGIELHHWHLDEPLHDADARARDLLLRPRGAYVMGRNMFGPIRGPWQDDWRGWWGDDPPYHAPVFVLTHYEHEPIELAGDPSRVKVVVSPAGRAVYFSRAPIPFGRQATAWEVAYATVWLLSGESSYVNAHPLVLDGGATSFG